jgi:hypothetical protein
MDKNFVATENDIRNLTQEHLLAVMGADGTRQTYLRVLVGTTIKELGGAKKARPMPQDRQTEQLAAVAAVHERFYAIVLEEVDKSLGGVPAKDRPLEKNRRSNFARTALSITRRYIKAGKDLLAVTPAKASKRVMEVSLPPRPATPRRLKGSVERLSKRFMAALLELSDSDPQGALSELDTLIGQMANQLAALGATAVTSPKKAVAEHRPLQVGKQLFVPTATTILRQRASPS